MDIGWLMFGFFVFITLVFMAIAFFLPEWVGITGKKAQEYIKEHQAETPGVSSAPSTVPSSATSSVPNKDNASENS